MAGNRPKSNWGRRVWQTLLLLLLVLAGAAAFYVYRALPKLDGEVRAAGLGAPVQVQRDAADVAHISAQTPRDAWFGLGWVHAQERGWQLEFNRRVMRGELSEALGDATLETDKLLRTLGVMRAARAQLAGLPAEAQEALRAYSDGINAFHATSGQALPPEFHVLGIRPGGASGVAWSPEDSVGWSIMMALDLGGNWGNELARLSSARVLPTERLWQLYPPYPGEPPASNTDFSKLYNDLKVFRTEVPAATKTGAIDAEPVWAKAGFGFEGSTSLRSWAHDMAANAGNVEGKGSNNWVVAGSRSTTGKPLLANDPHLALSAPAIWYFARLKAPGLDVIGATLPGLPFVVIGRTDQVAWGFTNTGPDVQDLYLEQVNPSNPAQYRTPEGWADFATRTETIKVKDKPDVSFTTRDTRHGPVLSDAQAAIGELLDTKRFVLALRWSALEADNRTILAGLRANRARTVDELTVAWADYHSPMQNVVMADTAGRIAYKAVGKLPLRRTDNDIRGIAPSPGWDARYDWAGWIPFAETPQDNPTVTAERGWIATANQRIHGPDYPHFIGQDWHVPYRYDRIAELLAARPQHDIDSMRALQADVKSAATLRLLPTLRATTSTHALAAAALGTLKDFDGSMSEARAAPLVFSAWVDELTRGLLAPKLGPARFVAQYGKRQFRGAVETIMESNDEWWCAPRTCAEQSTAALDRALDRLQVRYGTDPAAWRWGEAHFALSVHRPFGNVPKLAGWFDVRVPTGGDSFTVNVGQFWANDEKNPFANRHAASMRVLYDLANLESSRFIYQTGQTGVVFSPRYSDMKDEWAQVQYRPLQLNPPAWRNTLVLNP
jgi:penicillin G amidase